MEIKELIEKSYCLRTKYAYILSSNFHNVSLKDIFAFEKAMNNLKGKLSTFIKKDYTEFLVLNNLLDTSNVDVYNTLINTAEEMITIVCNKIITLYNENELQQRNEMELKCARVDDDVASANSGTIVYNPNDITDLMALEKANNVARRNEINGYKLKENYKAQYKNQIQQFYLQTLAAYMPLLFKSIAYSFTTIHHYVMDAYGSPVTTKLALLEETGKNIIKNLELIEDDNIKNKALDNIYNDHYLCVDLVSNYTVNSQEIFDKLLDTKMLSFTLINQFINLLKTHTKDVNYDYSFKKKYSDIRLFANIYNISDVSTIISIFVNCVTNAYILPQDLKDSPLLKFANIEVPELISSEKLNVCINNGITGKIQVIPAFYDNYWYCRCGICNSGNSCSCGCSKETNKKFLYNITDNFETFRNVGTVRKEYSDLKLNVDCAVDKLYDKSKHLNIAALIITIIGYIIYLVNIINDGNMDGNFMAITSISFIVLIVVFSLGIYFPCNFDYDKGRVDNFVSGILSIISAIICIYGLFTFIENVYETMPLFVICMLLVYTALTYFSVQSIINYFKADKIYDDNLAELERLKKLSEDATKSIEK